jgi:hypothetical protein
VFGALQRREPARVAMLMREPTWIGPRCGRFMLAMPRF